MNNNGIITGFENAVVTPKMNIIGNTYCAAKTGVYVRAEAVVSDNGLVRDLWHNPCHKPPKTLPQPTGG